MDRYFQYILLLLYFCSLPLHAMNLGREILRFAVFNNYSKVQELIDVGADINARNKAGKTALMMVTQRGYEGMAKFLLDAGANINARDKDGQTALHLAAGWSDKYIVKLLLTYGAHINAQDNDGDTALIKAARFGKKDIVQLLLNARAATTIKNILQKTALDCAQERTLEYKKADYENTEHMLLIAASAREKLKSLREQAAQGYAALYPGIPVQEIIKYLEL